MGAAIAASGIPRNQLFITSKLHPQTHGYWSTLQARGGAGRAGRRGEVELEGEVGLDHDTHVANC